MRNRTILIMLIPIVFLLLIMTPISAQLSITFQNEIKVSNLNSWGLAIYNDNAYVVTYNNNLTIIEVNLVTGSIIANYSLGDSFEIMDIAYGDNYFWGIAFTWSGGDHNLVLMKFNKDFEPLSTIDLAIDAYNSYIQGITYRDGYIWSILVNGSINYLARISMDGTVKIEHNLTNILHLSDNEYLVDVEFLAGEPVVLHADGLLENLNGEIVLNATKYIGSMSSDTSYSFDGLSIYNDKLVVKYSYYSRLTNGNNLESMEEGSGFLIFNIQSEGETSSGGPIPEKDAPAVATSSLASAAVAVGAGALVTAAAAGTPATVTTAGSAMSQTTGSPRVSTAGIESSVGGPSLSGKLRSLALKMAKFLAKLIRRKKKREEGEEEFEKPSFFKTTIFLAIIGAIIGGYIGLVLSKPIMQLFSVLSSSIGLSLGAFGATIGSILLYFYLKSVIILKRIVKKLSLYASVIGGYYGVISSTITLVSLTGYLGLLAFLVLVVIASLIGIIVLGLSLS